ncbi:hypothetical protein QWZ08_07135 [Ferruginibacter paludis]|uniref:hypothetical protein n=1 Tax=Ferruginibacter paludis TaxID=1310417 RepID=UPI0025B5DE8F|nr:hypothetical protein [Ferruginibacter paludis]MDN3655391.1 hypothetical protein [Ferruginibacter paludis]
MINFFTNTHEAGSFNFELEKKVRISGKIFERWVQLLSRSIACGEDKKRIIEKKVGITKTEREDLESLLKGSVGVKGIASIESQIKAKTGIEVKFEYATTETEETTFKAPECGRKTLVVYQLVREYDITITDKRLFSFSKGQTRILLTEYTDNIHDKSLTTEIDPDCGCKDKSEDVDDGILSLLVNNYYQLVTPYKIKLEKVTLKNLGVEVTLEDLGKMLVKNYQIQSSTLPDYIVFLGGIKSEQVGISLNTNGNLAFDYVEKITFNQDLPIFGYQGAELPGSMGVGYHPAGVRYGFLPIDPYNPYMKGYEAGKGGYFVPRSESPYDPRFFRQEGEGQANE